MEVPLAVLGLLLLAPILALAALAVRLSSPGPVLFRQERVGRHGKLFTLYKFRTMRVSSGGNLVTARGDVRVTAVGRFLRKTKLDELPELWNVLRGDMAFVGPRPEVPELVEPDDPLWRKVLEARPGITDPVTLALRNEEELIAASGMDPETFYREVLQPRKLAGYLRYLPGRTAVKDLAVLVKTLVAIVFPAAGDGAPLKGVPPEEGASDQEDTA